MSWCGWETTHPAFGLVQHVAAARERVVTHPLYDSLDTHSAIATFMARVAGLNHTSDVDGEHSLMRSTIRVDLVALTIRLLGAAGTLMICSCP